MEEIISRAVVIKVAIDLIVQHIRELLAGGSRIPKIEHQQNSLNPESPTRKSLPSDPHHKRPH